MVKQIHFIIATENVYNEKSIGSVDTKIKKRLKCTLIN